MKKAISQRMTVALVAAILGISSASARDGSITGDKGSDMLIDLVVVRPLGVAATAIGAVAFVVALPFTIPSGSVKASAREMVQEPAAYTFTRPLGEFDRCGRDGGYCGAYSSERRSPARD
jgi:hypothetical protein